MQTGQGYPGQAPAGSGYPGQARAPPAGGYPGQAGAPPGPAGYRPPGPGYPGAQPQVDPNIAGWFNAVDQDRSGQISASELQKALVNGNWSHFSEEACRMMIGMYFFCLLISDSDMFCFVFCPYFEMKILFVKISVDMFDRDRSGTISVYEFGDLFGYINQWKKVFENIDKDRSGFIEFAELQTG